MSKILIFAGTTEGRILSETLASAGIENTVCVATEYGEVVLDKHPLVTVRQERLDQEQMRELMHEQNFDAVVDATHPYAYEVTRNIVAAMEGQEIAYYRLSRSMDSDCESEKVVRCSSHDECAKQLIRTGGNILLTTGMNHLDRYSQVEELKSRLYARVLPGIESIEKCMQCGISGKQIIAMQGPFSLEMNLAIMRQYQIEVLVTKRSGSTGGYDEKIEAAKQLGITTYVIDPEYLQEEKKGYSFSQICEKLSAICGRTIAVDSDYDIVLAGVGMGDADSMTEEVRHAILNADILLGAGRLIAPYSPRYDKKPYYKAGDIKKYMESLKDIYPQARKIVILFSGDSGFYSGASKLYEALGEWKHVRVLPGVSSISYLAARLGVSYQDALICSMHGVEIRHLVKKLQTEKKIFFLLSGLKDMHKLGKAIMEARTVCSEDGYCIEAGYNLSYPDQKIMRLTARECLELTEEGLYVCLVRNDSPTGSVLTLGMPDEAFDRAKVPMTKEEIRTISISKLHLSKDSVVYDIGSGTGSVSAQIAMLHEGIRVYAIEKKEDAFALTKQNMQKHHLDNVECVYGEALECMHSLEMPTHAFIGGSGGNLEEILEALYSRNPHMRVVINAVSMETITLVGNLLSKYKLQDMEAISVQISKTHKVGDYHMMQAQNPVWIYSFTFSTSAKENS